MCKPSGQEKKANSSFPDGLYDKDPGERIVQISLKQILVFSEVQTFPYGLSSGIKNDPQGR